MAGSDSIDRNFFFSFCQRIEICHISSDTCSGKYLLYRVIVFWLSDERKKFRTFVVLIFLKNSQSGLIKGNENSFLVFLNGLGCNIFNRSVYDIRLSESHKVAHSTSYAALKYKYVSLAVKVRSITKIAVVDCVQFFLINIGVPYFSVGVTREC